MDTNSLITSQTGVQKIGKPVSIELPKVKDPTINLRDRLNDVLATEKHNIINYQIGINETINDDLRQIIIDNRNSLQNLHSRLFNELFNLGEYTADIASDMQITDTLNVFTNYKSQLPFNQ